MEHEIEKTIREKIMQAEQGSVSWNKDRVWDNVHLKHEKTNSRLLIYAAAACILIGLASGIYVIHDQRTNQLNKRMLLLEASILNKETAQKNILLKISPQQKDDLICYAIKKTAQLADFGVASEKNLKEILALADTLSPKSTALQFQVIETPNVSPLTFSKIDSVSSLTTSPERKILAIVGIIPTEETPTKKSKRKKLKFDIRLSTQQNSVAAAAEENKSFTARLN